MQILVKRLRSTETARIGQTQIDVLRRIEAYVRTRTEDQVIDQIMLVETAADQKAPFLILPFVLQEQTTDMDRLVHDAVISQHLVLQLVEVIFQPAGKLRRHEQAFICRIGILRAPDKCHIRRMPVSIQIPVSPVITLPVRMLRGSIYVQAMFIVFGEKIEFQAAAIDTMIRLFRHPRFMRRTVDLVAATTIFANIMIFKT